MINMEDEMTLSPELLAIAARLKTQDNRATDNPMFSAQEKRREYGYDSDYTSDYIWVDEDCELGEVPEALRVRAKCTTRTCGTPSWFHSQRRAAKTTCVRISTISEKPVSTHTHSIVTMR